MILITFQKHSQSRRLSLIKTTYLFSVLLYFSSSLFSTSVLRTWYFPVPEFRASSRLLSLGFADVECTSHHNHNHRFIACTLVTYSLFTIQTFSCTDTATVRESSASTLINYKQHNKLNPTTLQSSVYYYNYKNMSLLHRSRACCDVTVCCTSASYKDRLE